jgi:hypothetical protein
MTIFTDDEARRSFDSILTKAQVEGEVLIKRGDGQEFIVRSVNVKRSPLDVGSVNLDLTAQEIVDAVRQGRER